MTTREQIYLLTRGVILEQLTRELTMNAIYGNGVFVTRLRLPADIVEQLRDTGFTVTKTFFTRRYKIDMNSQK